MDVPPSEEKPVTARFMKLSDFPSMPPKMVPLRVPSVPIRVVNASAAPANPSIPGVLVAKQGHVAGSGQSIFRAGPGNYMNIMRGKAVVVEKAKESPANPAKGVPNILRNSPAKNVIDRQIVSHETTIELRKSAASARPAILSKPERREEKPELLPGKPEKTDLLRPLAPENAKVKIEEVDCTPIYLEVTHNELGAIEFKPLKGVDSDDSDSIDLTCKEDQPPPSPTKKDSPPVAAGSNPKIKDDDILCCGGCGCYGMAGEFYSGEACSNACQIRIAQRSREREKKERELAAQKLRREQRKREKDAREAEERLRSERESAAKRSQAAAESGSDAADNEPDDDGPERKVLFDSPHPWLDIYKGFSWSKYLECTNSKAAPSKLFSEAYPSGKNLFEPGMKLEAIDPEHPALICVASIVKVQGFRILVHFDGYPKSFDFWENASSANIFPVGWCDGHRQKLLPPPAHEAFSWKSYLSACPGSPKPAPKECFYRHKSGSRASPDLNGWKVGLKLEAVDRQNTSLICVATVTNVMDGRVLIHFDGWDLDYDYWVTNASPYVHPKGWCAEAGIVLNKPKGYRGEFSWDRYLEETRSKAVPNWAFRPPKNDASHFRKGSKLECVDKRNRSLVRVATVADVLMRQVKIHFDGWPNEYDFWCEDDSADLHPINWCNKTGHELMPPLTVEEVSYYMAKGGCETPGCRGLGHVRGFEIHEKIADCPYLPDNMKTESSAGQDRLQSIRSRCTIPTPSPDPSSRISTRDSDEEVARRKRKRTRVKDGDGAAGKRAQDETARTFDPSQQIRNCVFRPGYDPDPGSADKALSWTQNSAFLRGHFSANITPAEVSRWTSKQVAHFLATLPNVIRDTARLEAKIVEEEIDGEALLLMAQTDFVKLLGLKLGPAIKVFNTILLIKSKRKKQE